MAPGRWSWVRARTGSGRIKAHGVRQDVLHIRKATKNSVPELDWSVIFVFRNREWATIEKLPGKKTKIFRVAIPARTARHKQAAVHTQRSAGGETILNGFRKVAKKWECVASDEKSRGRISLNVG